MPIAATLAAERGIAEMRKEMKKMWDTINTQRATIHDLELAQKSVVSESNLQAALLNKAETSEIKRWFSGLRHDIDKLKQQRDNSEMLVDALKKTVKLEQFNVLEKRMVDLHTVMDATASQLFDRYATSMESVLSGKADVGMVQTALKTKSSQMEVKELTADVGHLRGKISDLQQSQKVLPSIISEVVLSKLGPELIKLQEAQSKATDKMKEAEKKIGDVKKKIGKIQTTVTGGGQGKDGMPSMDERVLQMEKQQAGVLAQLKKAQQKNQHIVQEQNHITTELDHAREAQNHGMAAVKHQRVATVAVAKQQIQKQVHIERRIEHHGNLRKELQQMMNERTRSMRSEIASLGRDRDMVAKALEEVSKEHAELLEQSDRDRREVENVRGPLMDQITDLREESRAMQQELQRQQNLHRRTLVELSARVSSSSDLHLHANNNNNNNNNNNPNGQVITADVINSYASHTSILSRGSASAGSRNNSLSGGSSQIQGWTTTSDGNGNGNNSSSSSSSRKVMAIPRSKSRNSSRNGSRGKSPHPPRSISRASSRTPQLRNNNSSSSSRSSSSSSSSSSNNSSNTNNVGIVLKRTNQSGTGTSTSTSTNINNRPENSSNAPPAWSPTAGTGDGNGSGSRGGLLQNATAGEMLSLPGTQQSNSSNSSNTGNSGNSGSAQQGNDWWREEDGSTPTLPQTSR